MPSANAASVIAIAVDRSADELAVAGYAYIIPTLPTYTHMSIVIKM